jgi:hypothetical protein
MMTTTVTVRIPASLRPHLQEYATVHAQTLSAACADLLGFGLFWAASPSSSSRQSAIEHLRAALTDLSQP